MANLHFRAEIKIYNANPYVLVELEKANKLKSGWKNPLPVLVRVNKKPDPPWKINMMPTGDGSFYLYLHGDVRRASNTKVGDIVMVDVSFDKDYKNGPMHPIPSWFEKELGGNTQAKENWDKLIPSRQKEILRYFSWLKSDEAKQRNLQKVVNALSGKETRFMARSWKNGK